MCCVYILCDKQLFCLPFNGHHPSDENTTANTSQMNDDIASLSVCLKSFQIRRELMNCLSMRWICRVAFLVYVTDAQSTGHGAN